MDRLNLDAAFTRNLSSLPVRAHGEGIAAGALQMLWRRRGVIAAATGCGLLAGVAALAVLRKQYAADAVIQLDLSRREAPLVTQHAPGAALEANALIQGEARIIQSRPIARQVVTQLGLAEAVPETAEPSLLSSLVPTAIEHARRLVERLRGIEQPSGSQPAPLPPDPVTLAVDDLLAGLAVSADSRSYLVTVRYLSPDPELSARLANAVTAAYLRWRSAANEEASGRTANWIAGQIEAALLALREAEAEITAFRERTGLLGSGRADAGGDSENVQQQQLRALTGQLNAASAARLAEERRLARVQDLLRNGNAPSTADVQGLPLIPLLLDREATARRELGEMLSRLGVRHPSVLQAQAGLAAIRGRIASELQRAVAVIAGDLGAARATEAALQQRLDELQRTMIAGKAHETELRNLLDGAQAIRDRLASLRRSHEQALAARDLRPVVASLVQEAEPQRVPAAPKPPIVLGLSAIAGLCAGIALAVLLERRDRGLRSSADVRTHLDTRCLGMVPSLAAERGRLPGAELRAAFDEAVYSVAAGVSLFDPPGECRVVLVTSSLPGEGKSTLCRALATALIASGRRVMLVNGVPGRAALPAPGAGPTGSAGATEAVPAPLASEDLAIIDRRSPFALSADVFGPGSFGTLLNHARRHFDVILLEGAPVLLVADSLVLGRLADTVIHVAQWSHTRRAVVEAALRRLQEHSIAVDGVVLSQVDLRRHARSSVLDEAFFYRSERRFYERVAGQRGGTDLATSSRA